MKNFKCKTKLQLIEELGISSSTFYRRLKHKNIKPTQELLNPRTENEIRVALGFPPLEFEVGEFDRVWHSLK